MPTIRSHSIIYMQLEVRAGCKKGVWENKKVNLKRETQLKFFMTFPWQVESLSINVLIVSIFTQ